MDLLKGKVVRLVRGDPGQMKVYSVDPVATALRWEEEGASALHIIDLDATLERGSNLNLVEEIAAIVHISVQVGGGIRDASYASRLLDKGVNRILLGTLAFRDAEAVSGLLKKYGDDRVMVALDYRRGKVMTRGWRQEEAPLHKALLRFQGLGVKYFLLTDIQRDGTLEGPDLETLAHACRTPRIQVVASGGVRDLTDLAELKRIGVAGVVIGKALYEGMVSLKEAARVGEDD